MEQTSHFTISLTIEEIAAFLKKHDNALPKDISLHHDEKYSQSQIMISSSSGITAHTNSDLFAKAIKVLFENKTQIAEQLAISSAIGPIFVAICWQRFDGFSVQMCSSKEDAEAYILQTINLMSDEYHFKTFIEILDYINCNGSVNFLVHIESFNNVLSENRFKKALEQDIIKRFFTQNHLDYNIALELLENITPTESELKYLYDLFGSDLINMYISNSTKGIRNVQ